jgi:hypothetical protein
MIFGFEVLLKGVSGDFNGENGVNSEPWQIGICISFKVIFVDKYSYTLYH